MNRSINRDSNRTARRRHRHACALFTMHSLLMASIAVSGCDIQGLAPLTPLGAGTQADPKPKPQSPNPSQNPQTSATSSPPAPVSPFESGSYIFALSPDAIEGFTYTNSGASVEHWTLRPPMIQGRAFMAGATLDDRIYAIGGNTLGGEVRTVEMLDLPGSGVWSQVADLPAPRTGIAAAAANGRIYAMGGFRSGAGSLDTNEEYDPATDTWTPRAANPTPRSYAAAVAFNGRVYLLGGLALVNGIYVAQSSVDEYDPATDTWTPKAPMPTARHTLAVAELNGKIYAVGGLGGANAPTALEEYDPIADVWTPRSPMKVARTRLGAFGWNGKLYAIGGWTAGGGFVDAVEEYSPEFDGWTNRMPMPSLRHSFGYASIGPSFYRLGGVEPGGQPGNYEDNVCIEYFAHTNLFPFRKD